MAVPATPGTYPWAAMARTYTNKAEVDPADFMPSGLLVAEKSMFPFADQSNFARAG